MGFLGAAGKALRTYWQVSALGLIWLLFLVALLMWGLTDRANAKTDGRSCRSGPTVTGLPVTSPKQPGQLKPRAEPSSTVAFFQDRSVAMRRVEYDITDPANVLTGATNLDVAVGPFLSTVNSREIVPADISATARVERTRVILDVCFNRTDPNFGSPGSYSGVVTITDPRVTLTDVAFTVTMSYPWWQLVAAVLVAMLLPAVLYVWFLRGSFASQTGLSVKDLQEWIFSRVTLMSLGAGMAAALGIFSATYARSEAWGTDYTAATALFGATFSAFVAAATGVNAAGSDNVAAQKVNEKRSQAGAGQPAAGGWPAGGGQPTTP